MSESLAEALCRWHEEPRIGDPFPCESDAAVADVALKWLASVLVSQGFRRSMAEALHDADETYTGFEAEPTGGWGRAAPVFWHDADTAIAALRALLDAAPAGGAEVERLRSVIDGTETVIHAPSEVPHQHGGTDAPECTTCAPSEVPHD